MCKCQGTSVMAGVAIGPLHFYQRPARRYVIPPCADPEAELERMEAARKQAIEQQSVLYEKALEEAGAEIAAVFEVHALMLEDREFVEAIRENILTHHMHAEYAVRCAAHTMVDRFADVEDEYIRARVDDIMDMARGVIYLLQGGVEETAWGEPAIVVADELSPSETVRMDKKKVLGFVTRLGSAISHTSILARSMELPALVAVTDTNPEWEGHIAILDGLHGELIVDPDVDTLIKYRQIQQEIAHRKKLLHRLKGCPNETLDGHRVEVWASVGKREDLESAKENDAGGIGQVQSDYLYVGQSVAPDEETQFKFYKELVQAMPHGPVQISTVDWGATNPLQDLQSPCQKETNLFYRGIRRSLTNAEEFCVQIRAMLRAAALGDVRLILPVVTNVQEVQRAKELVETCRQEMIANGVTVGTLQIGILIETPAAVWIADELAEEADFFLIGTNDLTQYICILDRSDMQDIPYADLYHPAVMRAIYETIKAGHRHGIPVGIAGALCEDTTMAEHFLRMGVDSFTVPSTTVLPLRNCICHLDLREPASEMPGGKL